MRFIAKYFLIACIIGLSVFGVAKGATVLFPYQGGTGVSSGPTKGDVLVGNTSSAYAKLSATPDYSVLHANSGATYGAEFTSTLGDAGNYLTAIYVSDAYIDTGLHLSGTVVGDIDMNGGDLIWDADGDTYTHELADDTIEFTSSAATASWVFTKGNVGIGDTTPDANLEVVDDFMVSSTATGDGNLFTVLSTGNVGIGTTSPSRLLDVNGVDSAAIFRSEDNTTDNLEVDFASGSSGTVKLALGDTQDRDRAYILYDNSTDLLSMRTAASASDHLAIDSSGNVGIADSTPASLLTVGNGDLFQIDSSGIVVAIAGLSGATGTYDFGGGTSFELPSGAALTVDAAGELMIDTTDDQLVYYGGAERVLSYENEVCFALEDPVAADDNVPFFFPRNAITITDVYCQVDGGTSIELIISDGTNVLETITCDADGAEDDGSIANGTFTALERMEFDLGTVTGTNTWLNGCVTYTIDRQ